MRTATLILALQLQLSLAAPPRPRSVRTERASTPATQRPLNDSWLWQASRESHQFTTDLLHLPSPAPVLIISSSALNALAALGISLPSEHFF